jgi:lipoprotein NlpI
MPMIRNSICLLSLATALVAFGFSGCTSLGPEKAQSAVPISDVRTELPRRLEEVERRAWQTVLEIVEVYEQIPADRCPGVAALTRQIRAIAVSPAPESLPRYAPGQVDELTTGNPNFWRATLEIAPSDGSLLLLQASLLASAGEVWRAGRILTATTQLLPIPASLRPYYLAHVYGFRALVLTSAELLKPGVSIETGAQSLERLGNSLQLWPNNALVLADLIDRTIRIEFVRSGKEDHANKDRLPQLFDHALLAAAPRVEELWKLDPIAAAPYRGNAEQRRSGRDLRVKWSQMSDSDSALGHKEIGELAQQLEAAGIDELAFVLYRLQIVARGFPAPNDVAAMRRLWNKSIGSEATAELFAAADRGEINVVELNRASRSSAEEWKGDPAIHPLLMMQSEREIADASFQIEYLQANPPARAEALRKRAVLESRAGLFDAALNDLHEAMQLVGRTPELLIDEMIIHVAANRPQDAERLLQEAEKSPNGKLLARRERGLLRFGQGKFQEAGSALAEEAKSDPGEVYAAIMAELAARRVGKSQKPLLKRAAQSVRAGTWPEVCVRFLLGTVSEESLLREAQSGPALDVAQKLCEAYFIQGQVALAEGRRERGIELLQMCMGTGITGYVEFRLAKLELLRIEPAALEQNRRSKPPASDSSPAEPHHERSVEEELLGGSVAA